MHCSEDWGEISRSSAVKYGVKWETVGREESRGGSVTPKQGARRLRGKLLLV